MREIKFRGKRIGNGEWVYGWLYSFVPYGNPHERGYMIKEDMGDDYEVDPETVCQYTGLQDNNGKEIYERHILVRESPLTGQNHYNRVEWDAYNARFMSVSIGGTLQELVSSAIERGFNVADHPHLLEEMR